MKKKSDIVTFSGQTTYRATTAVGTTTDGAYVQLTVAGNSSAIFGSEIATVSTLFARYRVNRLRIEVGGTAWGTTRRFLGVKYVGENTGAPGVVSCLSLLDGQNSAVALSPQTSHNAVLELNNKQLAASGLEWRECDDSAEALGVYGELTIVSDSAEFVYVHFTWDISFMNLASSGLHLTPPIARALTSGVFTPSALRSIMDLRQQKPAVQKVEEDDWETVSIRRPRAKPGI